MSSGERITVLAAHHDEIVVLSIGGELDAATAPIFQAAVDGALTDDSLGLVFDLSAVKFLASAGLRVLVTTQERVTCCAVVADDPAITKPIQLTGLDEGLLLYPIVEDALAAVRNCLEPSAVESDDRAASNDPSSESE